MKTIFAVVLFAVIAMVAADRVNIVDQNPEIESRAGGLTEIVKDGVESLKSRIRDRTNIILSLLGEPPFIFASYSVNVVDNNSPQPTPVQVVDNSVNGVSVVDNSPNPGHYGDYIPPTPVQVVDNSHNGVGVVDNSPYPNPGFVISNPDPGFSSQGSQAVIQNPDPGFYQPGVINNPDPGFNQPGVNQGPIRPDSYYRRKFKGTSPSPDVYYRPSPLLRGNN